MRHQVQSLETWSGSRRPSTDVATPFFVPGCHSVSALPCCRCPAPIKVTPLEHTHECSRCVLETVNDVLSLKNRSVFQPGADLSLEIWKQLGVIINDEPTYGQTFRKNLPDRCRDPIRPRGNRRTELRD